MKGTLFSADFVKDTNGDLRLLELNTDTGFVNGTLNNLDFTEFNDILSTNNINEVVIIYKKVFHEKFVDLLLESLQKNSPFVTTIIKQEESYESIYPTVVEDAQNKFILKLVYDESALFDSMYCKDNHELYMLFNENNDLDNVAEFYIKSNDVNVDNLGRNLNNNSMPDLAIKNIDDIHDSIKFYKVGGNGTIEENFTNFIDGIDNQILITNYYETPNSTHQLSYRSINIVYGNNLDLINLANVVVPAILDKPTSVLFDPNININQIDEKHYYELATNYPNFGKDITTGIFDKQEIVDVNGDPILALNTIVGNTYKSYYISEIPDSDNPDVYMNWFYPGVNLPQGEITTSTLVGKYEYEIYKKIITNIKTTDGTSIRISPTNAILVYDSLENGYSYKYAHQVDPIIDKIPSIEGSLIDIISNENEVLEDLHHVYKLDMESVDNFFLYGVNANIKLISHNCFPAGTRITLSNGEYKNIENITEEDILLTFDEKNKVFGSGRIGSIRKTISSGLRYISTDDGNLVKSTSKHKFFTNRGWIMVENLKVGDILFNQNNLNTAIKNIEKHEESVIVYHILDVKESHTYFVENLLVHNTKVLICFTYDTPVKMWDGTLKNIGDINVGDYVLSQKDGKYVKGYVTEKLIHPTNTIVDVVKYKKMVSDRLHPFYDNGIWKPICEAEGVEFDTQYVDNFYNLEIDGQLLFDSEHNFIVEDFIVSGLGDNELLNNTFKRQSVYNYSY